MCCCRGSILLKVYQTPSPALYIPLCSCAALPLQDGGRLELLYMPVAVYFPIAQEIAFNCRSIGQDYIHLGCHARGRLKTRMHILYFLFPLFILVLLRVVGGSTFSFSFFSFFVFVCVLASSREKNMKFFHFNLHDHVI